MVELRCVVWKSFELSDRAVKDALGENIRFERLDTDCGLSHVDRTNLKVFLKNDACPAKLSRLERDIRYGLQTIGCLFVDRAQGPFRLVFEHRPSWNGEYPTPTPCMIRVVGVVNGRSRLITRLWAPNRYDFLDIERRAEDACRRFVAFERTDVQQLEWGFE